LYNIRKEEDLRMPRLKKIKQIKVEEFIEALKDKSVKKDLELLKQLHQEAKKAGLDKMTMEEIDEEIRATREEARKEAKARVKVKV
jgi:uncharacterized protein YihD (DUF1040 family)